MPPQPKVTPYPDNGKFQALSKELASRKEQTDPEVWGQPERQAVLHQLMIQTPPHEPDDGDPRPSCSSPSDTVTLTSDSSCARINEEVEQVAQKLDKADPTYHPSSSKGKGRATESFNARRGAKNRAGVSSPVPASGLDGDTGNGVPGPPRKRARTTPRESDAGSSRHSGPREPVDATTAPQIPEHTSGADVVGPIGDQSPRRIANELLQKIEESDGMQREMRKLQLRLDVCQVDITRLRTDILEKRSGGSRGDALWFQS